MTDGTPLTCAFQRDFQIIDQADGSEPRSDEQNEMRLNRFEIAKRLRITDGRIIDDQSRGLEYATHFRFYACHVPIAR